MSTEEETSFLAMPRWELAGWLVAFIIGFTTILFWYWPEGWSALRVLAGGVTLGGMSFFMLFINRLLVS
jgi:hypothetical protein